MVVYTFMNFIESVAVEKPIDFYKNGIMIATLNLNDHDDRYRGFMSQYGFDKVYLFDFDEYSNSYLVYLE